MLLLFTREIVKLGLDASARASEKNNPEFGYIINNESGQMSVGYTYNECPFEDGNKYAATKIEYKKTKPEIPIDKDKIDIYPLIEA